jgi:hypothetical protein
LQPVDLLQRKYENDEVDDDIEYSAHPSLDVNVIARARVIVVELFPRVRNWIALECSGQDK